jgi:H+/Cl- antiporter ClcA
MITEFMGILFIALSMGLLWYIFRGMRYEEENPVWGNILAAALNTMICIALAYWFLTGNIMTPNLIQNSSYLVYFQGTDNLTTQNLSANASVYKYILGQGGSGMYTVSAVNLPNFTVSDYQYIAGTYFMYDIIYIQIQDLAITIFFGVLAIINGSLFVYFMYTMSDDILAWFRGDDIDET